MATRNVTLTMPEDLFRQAKIYAAGHDTSVSALVTELLTKLLAQGDEYERAWAEELKFMETSPMRIGDKMPTREEAHAR
jgi:plasmid stability protein